MNSRPTKQLTAWLLTLAFVLIPVTALCAGAAARAAAPATSPTLSLISNGAIAFTTFAGGSDENIHVVNADGTGSAPLINAFDHQKDPAWSSDGKYIAYSSAQNGYFEIYRADADGSNQTRLSDGIDVGAVDDYPAWSPDGQQIVFVRNRQLWTVGRDGGIAVKLSTGSDEDEQPSWSPDGTKITFVRNWSSANAQVWVMNADGTEQTNLSNYEGAPDRTPAWSPDGGRIAFQRWNDIWVMDADGSNQTQLTFAASGGYNQPAWSPDGTRIAVTNGLDNDGEIFVMNADGSNITKIADGGNPSWRSLSPLTLTAADSADPVTPGTEMTYTLGVTNNNPLTATGATLTDALDAGTTFVSAGASRGSCATPAVGATGTVTCSLGDLAAGEQATVTLVVHVAAADGATLHNAATAAADYAGYDQQTQSAETSTQVLTPSADVYAGAWVETLYVPTGGQVVYGVSVFNVGPEPAAGVTLTSNFPAGVTLAAVNDDGSGSCAPAADGVNFTCTFGSLNVFEGRSLRVTANSNVAGAPYTPVTATFTAASTTPDNTPFNNTGSTDFFIASPPLPTPGAVDEAQLAYTLYDEGGTQTDIFRRRADGAGLLNLTADAADDGNFVWSPDGTKMVFVRRTYGSTINADIYLMDADGSNLVQLTDTPDEYDVEPAWSRDGTKLVFASQRENGSFSVVRTINADGTGLRTFSPPDGFDNEGSISPDGTRVAFIRRSYVTPDQLMPGFLYVVNADGSNPVRVEHAADVWDRVPVWSPDSARVVFNRFPFSGGGCAEIYTVRADGTDQRNLTNNATGWSESPAWSPDGARISFVTFDASYLLQVMNADGSDRHTVFDAAGWNAPAPVWSPDGQRLAFGTRIVEGSQGDVHVVNADGSGLLRVGGSDLEGNNTPDWSPDGRRLAFLTYRNGVVGINIVNADGTGRIALTNAPGSYGTPKWRPTAQLSGGTPAGGERDGGEERHRRHLPRPDGGG